MGKVVKFFIDDKPVEAEEGQTILEAARRAGIYIPSICYHPDLPPYDSVSPSEVVYRAGEAYRGDGGSFEGCGLCVVYVDGVGLVKSCNYKVSEGIKVYTNRPEVIEERKKNLMKILANHPHYCMTCINREGCSLTTCSQNLPENERCCPLLHTCELVKVSDYIGVPPETPRYRYRGLPVDESSPRIIWDFNLCIGCLRCVRACKYLAGVEAISYTIVDGEVVVGLKAPSREEADCRFCMYCVAVCPTGALRDKAAGWEYREENLVPCKYSCPAQVDVPRYVRLLAEGRVKEALVAIRERLPFPAILGRVCHHPCEENCNRADVNEAISIKGLKRFIAENGGDDEIIEELRARIKPNGKRVAIVGSGPAGLSAAYFLRLMGYDVVVYEERDKPGGLMRLYPEYRLPTKILDREIGKLAKLGITFRCGVRVGRDVSLDQLRNEYDAVLLAIGTPRAKGLRCEGADLDNIFLSLDFLREVKEGRLRKLDGKVIVIGGGNVAMDVARTCVRLGAEVHLVCLESRDEMPAHSWEIEWALEEGVKIHNSWGPKRFVGDGGRVSRVEFVRCVSVFDEQGRFNPKFDETKTMSLDADYVIIAIGQEPDFRGLEMILAPDGRTVSFDEATMMTNMPGVFVCGDAIRGPTSVVEAVADGRRAAIAIDKYLGGDGDLERVFGRAEEKPSLYLGRVEGFASLKRIDEPVLAPEERVKGFMEVTLEYSEEDAVKEASRCLRCDLRLHIRKPEMPPEPWLPLDEEHVKEVPETEGVIQLFDSEKNVILIKGVENMRQYLADALGRYEEAKYFVYEENKLYTMRESELLQQYIQRHGRMPKLNEEEFGGEEFLYE